MGAWIACIPLRLLWTEGLVMKQPERVQFVNRMYFDKGLWLSSLWGYRFSDNIKRMVRFHSNEGYWMSPFLLGCNYTGKYEQWRRYAVGRRKTTQTNEDRAGSRGGKALNTPSWSACFESRTGNRILILISPVYLLSISCIWLRRLPFKPRGLSTCSCLLLAGQIEPECRHYFSYTDKILPDYTAKHPRGRQFVSRSHHCENLRFAPKLCW